MPFKFKLKKSRQYNVTSKSLFVISVHHLLVLETPTTVDCTLSSESTGQECLDNVCQRLSIGQLEFFGLRYVVKGSDEELRWVDLDLPLSRQLEKYAAGPRLYLRVQYYVISGVNLITDEMTRNYYFLQLKSDVVEGRISCDPKQAVVLAIYCRQAQYNSHQSERHTVDYLKTLLPFPKQLIEAGLLETLTEEVLQTTNAGKQNLTQSSAEGLFITTCQQLHGYGQEKFPVKDDGGKEVTLGVTVSGIVVTASDKVKFYPWHDISNVVNHKRVFNIDCANPENNVGFTLQDAKTGRYFWRLCVLQHTFYMKYEQNHSQATIEQNANLFQNIPEDMADSRDNLFIDNPNLYTPDSYISNTNWQGDSVASSNISLAPNQQQQQQQLRGAISQNWTPSSAIGQCNSQRNSAWGLVGSSQSILSAREQSTSCLDLSNSYAGQEREHLKAFLPGYRPAPDYETAIQQKYQNSETELRITTMPSHKTLSSSGILSDSHINLYSGSQPDVHRITAVADAIFGQQLQQKYPDVTQTTNATGYQQPQQQQQPQHQQHHQYDPKLLGLSQQLQMMHFNKQSSPYATNRLSSTSTPDLALASHRALLGYRGAYVSGSSPDLVSTRTLLNSHLLGQPTIPPIPGNTFRYRYSQSFIPHGTYENLNFMEPPSKTNILSQKLQKAYEDAYRIQPLPSTSNGLCTALKQPHNGSIEPIYENVPLPRQDSNANEMRDRAASVQSSSGIVRFKQQQQQQHQLQNQQQLSDLHNFNRSVPQSIDRLSNDLHGNYTDLNRQVISKTFSNSSGINAIIQHENQPIFIQPTAGILHQNTTIAKQQLHSIETINPKVIAPSMNRSHSSNYLDSSQSSSSLSNTTATLNSSKSSTITSKEKKKRRWGFFGGGGGSGNKTSLNDKHTISNNNGSATLGRDKEKTTYKSQFDEENENNFRHRWSTGLPRLPLPASISKEKLCQILKAKLDDPQLYMEFERIPKRKDKARYECALHEENISKNNDPHFLPYDENRVRITPTRENRMGYLNATHITATVGNKQRFYIVAQTTQILSTFLQCIWEADVYLIVQLLDDVNYVPATNNKCLEFGQFQVWQEFSEVTERCVTSKLRIYHSQSKRYRSVWHIKCAEWGDQNCPNDVGQFLEFVEELNSVRLASINEVPPGHNTNPPVLIHCSDAAGRSGVTLTADLLLYTLDHNQDLDIPRVVSQLRHQRDNIIPSLVQYKFIYALLIHYLKRTRLI